ncbi:hypothetical protein NUSPORA_01825 [Nucleospora cyclopteri]
MDLLVLASGRPNSIFLSILPGLISAESRDSILLVAMITFMSSLESNPSSWFNSSKSVLCISRPPDELESYLFPPIASISSIKIIEGACASATLNISLTSFGPSPRYFCISSDPTILRNVADVWFATAFASRVLPVPGSPYRITPLGGFIPISWYNSGCVSGNSTDSFISCICVSNPPMSAYVSVGAFSSFITFTSGSTSGDSKTPTTL